MLDLGLAVRFKTNLNTAFVLTHDTFIWTQSNDFSYVQPWLLSYHCWDAVASLWFGVCDVCSHASLQIVGWSVQLKQFQLQLKRFKCLLYNENTESLPNIPYILLHFNSSLSFIIWHAPPIVVLYLTSSELFIHNFVWYRWSSPAPAVECEVILSH